MQWVLATFRADVPAQSSATYYLTHGRANRTASSLEVRSDGTGRWTVDAGVATFVVNTHHFSLLESVEVGDTLVSRWDKSGLVLRDARGISFQSVLDAPASFVWEDVGPVRAVARAEGALRAESGGSKTDYIVHLYFYAGKSYVRVLYTVGNHLDAAANNLWSSYDVFNYFGENSISFESLSYQTALYLPDAGLRCNVPSGAGELVTACDELSVYQDSSGTEYWNRYQGVENEPRLQSYVKFRGYEVSGGGLELARGERFEGWIDVSDSRKGVTLGMPGFWQNFPKGFSADASGRVAADILPSRFVGVHNLRVGEEKTTELFLYFHLGGAETAGTKTLARALSEPMIALAPPRWYSDTEALPPYVPTHEPLEARFGRYEADDDRTRHDYYIDRALIVDPSYPSPEHYYHAFHSLWQSTEGDPSSTDYFDFYGWSWYGNQPLDFEAFGPGQAGPFNTKYHIDFGAWLQLLRSGDLRWRTMAEAYSRHLEALMLHDVETETGWDISRWKNAVFGHAAHGETGNRNSVRNYLGPVGDTAFGARGAALHHFLTGYPPSRRFVEAAASYAHDVYRDAATKSDFAPSREAANALTMLVEGFRVTGESRFLDLARKIVEGSPASAKPYIKGPVPGSDERLHTWFFGLYYDALARYASIQDAYGHRAEAAFAWTQLAAYLEWQMTYASRSPSGWLTTYYLYNVDGRNDPEETDTINNWTLLLADSCAYAYLFTKDPRFLEWGRELYRTGTRNPFFLGSPLIYSSAKESVNAMVYGHVWAHLDEARGGCPSAPQ